LPSELEVVSDIAREAGAIVLKHYQAGAGAEAHKDGEPVTAADRESDAYIVRALRRAFPDDEIVSEESSGRLARESGRGHPARLAAGILPAAGEHAAGAAGAAVDLDVGAPFQLEHSADAEPPAVEHAPPRVWYVDPMDGTSDFVARTGDFVVMIGLAIAGWPVLGVVYHPPSDTLYRGGHGLGAEKLAAGERTELQVSGVRDPRQARLVVSRSHTPEIVAGLASRLGFERLEPCGSVGLKAARIAEGTSEVYLHPSIGTKLWDTCAPEAILVAAGGTFSDCDGKPLVYDRRHLHNERGIIASNGRLHDILVEALAGTW
jgi:3'(2'), 5'-bisphosphate nucleotidase